MRVFFRAALMLSVLVGLPAAWVYYGPLPAGGQKVVNRVVRVVQEAFSRESQPPPSSAIDTAPRYNAPAPAQATSVALQQPIIQKPIIQKIDAQQVEPLLAQLRGHGVAEYQLDRWGSEGRLYRFQCQMPLAGSDDHTRQFEAVAEDPIASVRQVVEEVGSWQLARLGDRPRR